MSILPRFTLADAESAHDAWGANCGPAALAVVTGKTLDEVRPLLGDFEARCYMNPTAMEAALRLAAVAWSDHGPRDWPSRFGIVRIQWEGPWTAPGVPIRVRYRHTHWIAAAKLGSGIGIFDINAMANGTGWCALADWERVIVPFILDNAVPRASGGWHRTHVFEVEQPSGIAT